MSRDAALFVSPTAELPPRVCVVAELGVNHDGDVDVALSLVDAAAEAGADAVKVQVFCPQRLLSNQALLAGYQAGKADDARSLLARLALGVDRLALIRQRAQQRGLWFIATPFSPQDVADMEALDVDAVKIASPDAVNLPLLNLAAALGRPMLISTGTCDLDELAPAAMLLRSAPAGGAMLHCVSSYPTPRHEAALGAIRVLERAFDLPVGYSDHTPDLDTGALAVAAGAVVLEKHLTHDKAAAGPDHAVSVTGEELAAYISQVREAQGVMGPAAKRVLPAERDVRLVSRQSVCVVRDLPAGHLLDTHDLTIKRPGNGIPAAHLQSMIGRRLVRDVKGNDLLQAEDVESLAN